MILKFILFPLVLIFLVYPAQAQKTDFQSWNLITSSFKLGKQSNWLSYLEVQARVGDNFEKLERTLLRPALGYSLKKNLIFYVGYAWTPTYLDKSYDSDFRNEHRIWQQLLYKHSNFGFDLQHRLRQEQRFIQNASSAANRTRYLTRLSYKLSETRNYGLTGYNEIFINLNTVARGPKVGFDRDRIFFGPFIEFDNVRYELGYLGEFGKKFGKNDRMINAFFMGANFNF